MPSKRSPRFRCTAWATKPRLWILLLSRRAWSSWGSSWRGGSSCSTARRWSLDARSENDIVIEHKSISRHHARIVREGNQYYAVDLESANGVRVNGVDRDRVLLRSGDEIELGQVQLRFVTRAGVSSNQELVAQARARLRDRDRRRGGSGVGSHLCAFGPVATVRGLLRPLRRSPSSQLRW
jgi:hypothetical protein